MTGAAVESTRSGQVRLALPDVRRGRYVSGQQAPCASCGVRLGVSRYGPGSPPLCMPCWRGREDRARLRGRAQLRALLAAAAAEIDACAVCGSPQPTLECWLCSWSFLADARAEFDREQEQLAAEQERELARLREVRAALDAGEARVRWLTGWVARIRMVLTGYNEGHGAGRAVELLADLLARDAAARADSRGGRPSRLALVGAVLAADADPRAGRYAFPGRQQTADLVGCSTRSVTALWARCEALRWAERTRQGRKLSLVERIELQRFNDRVEFDLVPLHRGSTEARAPYIPQAARVYVDLLERLYGLLRAAESDLDALRALLPTTPPLEPQRRARWQLRAAVRQTRHSVLWITELSGQQALASFFSPRAASNGECVSSCPLRGLRFSPPVEITSLPGRVLRPRRGRMEARASRSSTRAGRFGHADLGGVRWSRGPRPAPHHTQRPRKPGAGRSAPQVVPGWANWAPALASDLAELLPWLNNTRRARVAATLGGNLTSRPYGRWWTAQDLLNEIMAARGGRPLLAEPDDATGYLWKLLHDLPALLRREEHVAAERRQLRRDRAAQLRQQAERRRREHEPAAPAAPNAAYRAACRQLEAARSSANRTTTPPSRRSTKARSTSWEVRRDRP